MRGSEEDDGESYIPVVFEVRAHEMAGSEGRHQTELPGQHCGAHHPGQLGGVGPGVGGVGALHPQHLQTRGLGGQDGTAAHRANLEQEIGLNWRIKRY